jgi:hypothetical protein
MDIVENEPKTTWDHTKSEFNGCQELISKNLVDDKDSPLLLLRLESPPPPYPISTHARTLIFTSGFKYH